MDGLMMEYPLTLDRIVEHANQLFAHKRVRTRQADGGLHDYTSAAGAWRALLLSGGSSLEIGWRRLPGITINISKCTLAFLGLEPFATH